MNRNKKSKRGIKKKGQARLSESVAVIFIFFVLVLFGIIFYYKYSQISFAEKEEQLIDERAIDMTLRTLFLPELMCTRGKAEPEDNCVDMMKVRHVNGTFKKHIEDYYFNLFGYAKIVIQEVYPGNERWVLYDLPRISGSIEYRPTFFVVTLKDEASNIIDADYRFGYLEVGIYT